MSSRHQRNTGLGKEDQSKVVLYNWNFHIVSSTSNGGISPIAVGGYIA